MCVGVCIYLRRFIPRRILGIIIMERRRGQYLVTKCWVVGAMFTPSIFEDRCVDLRRWMIDVPTFDGRCVIDTIRIVSMVVSTFEDQ